MQGTTLRSARFIDWGALRRGAEPIFVTIVEADFEDGVRHYFLPLVMSLRDHAKGIVERVPQAVLATVTGARKGVLLDAWHDDRFAELLLNAADARETFVTRRGVLQARQLPVYAQLRRDLGPLPVSRLGIATEPRSSTIKYGAALGLKLFRRVEAGVHPEVEITQHVTQAVGFTRALRIGAVLDYERRDTSGESGAIVGMIQEGVESQADGWTYTMEWLGRYFDHMASRKSLPLGALPGLSELAVAQPPAAIQDVMGVYLETASALGRRTGDMHAALGADVTNPAFSPEPFGKDDILYASREAMARADRVLQALSAVLGSKSGKLPPEAVPQAQRLLESRAALLARIRSFTPTDSSASKIRIHGDYRLAQVLMAEGDFYIENFEGHPSWPAAAQREKQSPLRDVASMIRSFSYAAHAALLTNPAPKPTDDGTLHGWARLWQTWAAAAFLHGYLSSTTRIAELVGESDSRDRLLGLFTIDRALRELDGELNNRPEWASIPLRGLLELLELQ